MTFDLTTRLCGEQITSAEVMVGARRETTHLGRLVVSYREQGDDKWIQARYAGTDTVTPIFKGATKAECERAFLNEYGDYA